MALFVMYVVYASGKLNCDVIESCELSATLLDPETYMPRVI